MKHRLIALVAALTASCLLAGCGRAAAPAGQGRTQIVTTTPILADLARHIAGDVADVHSLVPPGADPHSHEPSLRDVRSVVYADVAFSNYLMLEQHSIIRTLDANLRPGVPNIALAEAAPKYGGEVIPLVENVTLDTIWLGLRVQGTGQSLGADRASEVEISGTAMRGPGQVSAYLTETFGRPKIFTSSHDGFQPAQGFRDDTMTLPTDAHTHMSWAFGAPGIHRLDLRSKLRTRPSAEPIDIAEGTVTFAVGTDPRTLPEFAGWEVLDHGHADISTDLDGRRLEFYADPLPGQKEHRHLPLDRTVVWVPPKALMETPPNPEFRFLGKPGVPIHQLPQAVLGAHVHGEIDPHLWLSVRNTKAYVQIMRDTLMTADPRHAQAYARNTRAYLDELEALDKEIADTIATIPQARRQLITTHDAYAYLAQDYGLTVAGFVTPNPATEPSMAQRRKLSQTIRQLKVPAVFLEPNLARRSSTLRTIADEAGVRVCPLRADTFDREVHDYVTLMRTNARSLADCLGQPA